jgi:MarR family transcriptional regulator, organic hydroperoxide resistance regulator
MAGRLLRELKQSKPFPTLETEAILNLQKTLDVVEHEFEEVLKPSAVSRAQYNVLRILRGAEPVGLKCSEISERMVSRDPDITRLLDRLDKRGLISRIREERDRRVVRTRITAAGLELLATLDVPVESAGRRALGHLGPKRLAQLIELLEAARSIDSRKEDNNQ